MTRHLKSYSVKVFAKCNMGIRFQKEKQLVPAGMCRFIPQKEQLKGKRRSEEI